jgi:hypothetical protein
MPLFSDIGTEPEDISHYVNVWLADWAREQSLGPYDHLDDSDKVAGVRSLCQKLYEDLSVLDAKASGLISTNAITTALISAAAFTVKNPLIQVPFVVPHIALIVLLLFSITALALNASVLDLSWTKATELEERVQRRDRAKKLLAVRNKRTMRYRLSLLLHMVLLGLLFIGTLLAILSRISPGHAEG